MGIDPTERLPQGLHNLNLVIADLDSGKIMDMATVRNMLAVCHETLTELGKHCKYLDDSLTAAVTGELPARFDLNQLLLAKRAIGYNDYLKLKDTRDKTRPPGSNDAMIPRHKRS